MQLKEAEECLRGLAYLEWGSGTEDEMCRQLLASVDRNSRSGISNDVTLSSEVGFDRRVGERQARKQWESLLERKAMRGRGDVEGLAGG